MRRVTDHIDAFLGEDIALGDLAGLAGLSRAQFFRAFRQSTGTSPARYLRQQRIERAKRLILEDQLSFGEIAEATGFNTRNALCAAFRSEIGITSSEFRALVS